MTCARSVDLARWPIDYVFLRGGTRIGHYALVATRMT